MEQSSAPSLSLVLIEIVVVVFLFLSEAGVDVVL